MSIVQELRDYMANNPEFKAAFENSFRQALAFGIHEFRENNITTLDEYIAWYETFLTWIPNERQHGRHIWTTVCLFYCVMSFQPLQGYTSSIDPSTRAPFTWLSDWVVRYAKEIGKFMDTPESITPETVESFYNAPLYHMQDYPVPPGGWQTFNEFFARHIDPAVRPIADPHTNTTITSPADAFFDGMWPINDASECVFDVKGLPWSIGALLDDDEHGLGATFAGGRFCHSVLYTYDYHRLHAPVSGTVVEARVIEGLCDLGVTLEKDHRERVRAKAKAKPRRGISKPSSLSSPGGGEGKEDEDSGESPGADSDMRTPDEPGYQFCQTRGLILIDTGDIGLVAVLPVGMASISSVRLSVQEGDVVQKGDELAYFQFGGSDVVMVFQKEAKVESVVKTGDRCIVGQKFARASTC